VKRKIIYPKKKKIYWAGATLRGEKREIMGGRFEDHDTENRVNSVSISYTMFS